MFLGTSNFSGLLIPQASGKFGLISTPVYDVVFNAFFSITVRWLYNKSWQWLHVEMSVSRQKIMFYVYRSKEPCLYGNKCVMVTV